MTSYPVQVALEYFEQLEQSKPEQSLTDWIMQEFG